MASRRGKQLKDEAKAKQPTGKVEGEPLKINKWDSAAVKNALDDNAKKIMVDEFECVEDYTLIDRRLVLCTLACGFSVFALIYDYLFPFPRSGTVLAACAISYFVLMGVLTLYAWFVEGSAFMVAMQKDSAGVGADMVWRLSSSLPRFGHEYSITVDCSGGQANQKGSCSFKKSVTKWFDEEGTLVSGSFHADFTQLCKNAESGKTQ